MTAVVIPFPNRSRVPSPTAPHPYDFWYGLLHGMASRKRQATIREAARCGVISDRDAYILATSWPEDGVG